MPFLLFIAFLISQRLAELLIAARNERWLRAQGAIEYGQKHYPVMVAMHTCFVISLLSEYWVKAPQDVNTVLLIVYLFLVALKAWIISSLGSYWNTKIFRVPGAAPVAGGLYRYVKHPNYLVVIAEILVIPLVFHLYITSIVFSVLNAFMLRTRIREENRVWALPQS